MSNAKPSDTPTPHFALLGPPLPTGGGRVFSGLADMRGTAASGHTPAAHSLWEQSIHDMEDSDKWCCFFGSREVALWYWRQYVGFGLTFDLVALYECADSATASVVESMDGFLGFDVANTTRSAIEPARILEEVTDDEGRDRLAPIWRMYSRFAAYRVNANGLLDSYSDASLVRDVVRYVVEMTPDFSWLDAVDVLGIVRVQTGG